MTKLNIPAPCDKEVKFYLEEYKSSENEHYIEQEKVIQEVFTERPKNTNLKDVMIKSCLLNDFYSTNIFDIFTVSKHITTVPNIDERLKNGDLSLVGEIAKVRMKDGNIRNFYSFASKYCSHHNVDAFPIFDSFVEKMLWHFANESKFCKFSKHELRDYAKFNEVLRSFIAFYKLRYGIRRIDRYLWLAGKDYFRRYSKAKQK